MRYTGTPAWKHRLLLVALGACGALLLIELSVRIATHSVFARQSKDSESRALTDPAVGRIPKPGISFRHPSGFTITIGDYGTRWNGDTTPRAERPLTLAVGDSFAFGDGVNDEESWPAVLERLSGRRVINAAVPGFGLDQAVLRATQLAGVYAPDIIIVSFIPHDVLRCEMSYWSGHPKPYFDIDAGGLRLHTAPVPSRSVFAPLKRLLSASVAMDLLFTRFLYWDGPEEVVVHRRGREVACLLMERLAALGRTHHARIVLLAQPQEPTATPEQLEIKNAVLACAEANHLLALDLFPVIGRLPLEQRTALFPRHMSPEGNQLVASELARFLERSTLAGDAATGVVASAPATAK
jgi:hypothetical protein